MSRAVGSSLGRAIRLDTLRGRLSILLIVVTITPIVLIGFTSYYWMYKGQSEKIVASYQSMVDGQRAAIEKAAANLGSVSQLLVVDGGLGDDIIAYLTAGDPVEKTALFRSIDKSLINIAYSNLIVNGLFFFMPDYPSAYQFESAPIKPDLPDTLLRPRPEDVLYRANQLMFLGPHPSALAGHDEPVISLTRLVEYGADRSYYMYLEAEFGELLRPAGTETKDVLLNVLTQADGTVMYSDWPEGADVGGRLDPRSEGLKAFKRFESVGDGSWKLYSLIELDDFRRELRQWQRQFLLVAALSILVTILAASYIWRMVYHPIQRINRAIRRFSDDPSGKTAISTKLLEFDMLFASFQSMRERIIDLISEVERKEKRRSELEVEKLMSQINPHFLHNSLNTIQWLAKANGQDEIYNLVKVFTRVLHYNLGKGSMVVTIRDEIVALRDYIELQNVRYDHRFNVSIDCDPRLGEMPIPRFVLQPLVENSLYHGLLSEQGDIRVTIREQSGERLAITVADDGKGMSPSRMEELFEGGGRGQGLGIGLQYVKKMLDVHYGGAARLEIDSKPDKGTRIRILVPVRPEGGILDD
ncbi:histidine kinase [Cohnella sp. GCM10012308]|uniref:sensor histidine kinase n=1 Tax=Cohnella sp. GCM10012308 TaxID=3317329 RepID=UPI0036211161